MSLFPAWSVISFLFDHGMALPFVWRPTTSPEQKTTMPTPTSQSWSVFATHASMRDGAELTGAWVAARATVRPAGLAIHPA